MCDEIPRLVRLTGAHPLNVEAPLRTLFDEGFLTSPEMFYVRNHGAVPVVKDEDILDWTFSVEGLVDNPFSMTVSQLMSEFDQVTLPITLVCAGNRRKEQNVVRKTKGFSWGPAGCSTALVYWRFDGRDHEACEANESGKIYLHGRWR